jgi:hypothetical protein
LRCETLTNSSDQLFLEQVFDIVHTFPLVSVLLGKKTYRPSSVPRC